MTEVSINQLVKRPKHLHELDSLRGLAAVVVVLNHYHQVWMGTHHPSWISRPKLNPALWLLVNGHASVILFFLLSGFVLALPSLRGSSLTYPNFALRRVCRIYLPYVAGLSFAVLCCGLFSGRNDFGPEIASSWALKPDSRSVLQHLLMLGRFDVFRYDVPFWSLVHEMRISLIFPLIWFVASRLRFRHALVVAACLASLSALGFHYLENTLSGTVRMTGYSYTASFCGIFLLGAVIAKNWQQHIVRLVLQKAWLKVVIFIAGVTLYLYPPPAVGWFDISDLFIACGAAVILLYSLVHDSALSHCLRAAPIHFLGRISYSLYLVHYPVLLVLAYVTARRFPFALLLVPYLALSLTLATVLYKSIELPSMALGRLLAWPKSPTES